MKFFKTFSDSFSKFKNDDQIFDLVINTEHVFQIKFLLTFRKTFCLRENDVEASQLLSSNGDQHINFQIVDFLTSRDEVTAFQMSTPKVRMRIPTNISFSKLLNSSQHIGCWFNFLWFIVPKRNTLGYGMKRAFTIWWLLQCMFCKNFMKRMDWFNADMWAFGKWLHFE